MTWTQIDPDKLSQYEGMSPAQIGRKIIGNHTLDMLRAQQQVFAYTESFCGRPWEYNVSGEWRDFWKSVYDLKDKPESDWDHDDYFSYRAMKALLPASAVRDI